MGKLQNEVPRARMAMKAVKRVVVTLVLLFLYPVVLHCAEGTVPVVLDESDRYQIITRLEELKIRREQVKMFEAIIARDAQQDARDKELCAREVALLTQDRDVWKEKADSFQKAFEDAMKGRSKGCWVLKVLTIGLARCH